MSTDPDSEDKKQARMLALLLILMFAVIFGLIFYYATPVVSSIGATLNEGSVGVKQAAKISFIVSLLMILSFAIISGGGDLIGELPFMLFGFLGFFFIFWLLIAYIF